MKWWIIYTKPYKDSLFFTEFECATKEEAEVEGKRLYGDRFREIREPDNG